MDYFERFTSNTCAGSGNQHYFTMEKDEISCGRIFYKIAAGGKHNYSIMFSNIIDSTFEDGSVSHRNLICNSWKIEKARIGRCNNVTEEIDFKDLMFGGKYEKQVMPGEFFASDPVQMEFSKDEYLCLEITFSGKMIPYHDETLLPVYIRKGEKWVYSNKMPFAGMIGCDRKVKGRIAYLGDSITQGIGTEPNSYLHWNALLSEKIGNEYSFWNLGIGYGQASDAATDGAWLYKAKQNDIVFVCYGVNDILRGRTEKEIKSDLDRIVTILKKAGKQVILQTVPPFDYIGENIAKWNNINQYIKTVLSKNVDYVFDNTAILCDVKNPEKAIYGGHPNEEGCRILAQRLYDEIKDILR